MDIKRTSSDDVRVGTCIGEIPPYWMARAARLASNESGRGGKEREEYSKGGDVPEELEVTSQFWIVNRVKGQLWCCTMPYFFSCHCYRHNCARCKILCCTSMLNKYIAMYWYLCQSGWKSGYVICSVTLLYADFTPVFQKSHVIYYLRLFQYVFRYTWGAIVTKQPRWSHSCDPMASWACFWWPPGLTSPSIYAAYVAATSSCPSGVLWRMK